LSESFTVGASCCLALRCDVLPPYTAFVVSELFTVLILDVAFLEKMGQNIFGIVVAV
jgi:hypothetical protein